MNSPLELRLGNEQAVEGVAVVRGQGGAGERVRVLHGEVAHARATQPVGDVSCGR